MNKNIIGCCMALALATPAVAQTAPAPTLAVTAPTSQTTADWRSTKLVGTTVYNQANENIGEVADIANGSGGEVSAVIVSVGGFLGMGEKHVAMPFKSLKATRTDSNAIKLAVDSTKDSLKSMPAYKYLKS